MLCNHQLTAMFQQLHSIDMGESTLLAQASKYSPCSSVAFTNTCTFRAADDYSKLPYPQPGQLDAPEATADDAAMTSTESEAGDALQSIDPSVPSAAQRQAMERV